MDVTKELFTTIFLSQQIQGLPSMVRVGQPGGPIFRQGGRGPYAPGTQLIIGDYEKYCLISGIFLFEGNNTKVHHLPIGGELSLDINAATPFHEALFQYDFPDQGVFLKTSKHPTGRENPFDELYRLRIRRKLP